MLAVVTHSINSLLKYFTSSPFHSLQWGDKTALSLISEVLIKIGSIEHISRRCIFVGTFRHDEVDNDHPFSVQMSYLEMMTHNVNTTYIRLSSLSKEDVTVMLAEEFQLPHRIVRDLADVTHKKTSGHAVRKYFHSLVNNETILLFNSCSFVFLSPVRCS